MYYVYFKNLESDTNFQLYIELGQNLPLLKKNKTKQKKNIYT